MSDFKQPISALVVIHTPALDILLLERHAHPGYWQSVTGSRESDEALFETARREVLEETGIDSAGHLLVDRRMSNAFDIFTEWRHRYAPGVTQNCEHVFSLCVPNRLAVRTAPGEHRDAVWLPWREAAARCFSWTNRDAILLLARELGHFQDGGPAS
jgi:dATP pyrophosphohydrolase